MLKRCWAAPMLEPFGPDLWIAEGTSVAVLGFAYPTRCAVMRLAGDALLVWSPVTLTPQLQAQIADLGRVTQIVAPNMFHHLFVDQWQAAYPAARVFGLPALPAKRPDLRFDGSLTQTPAPAWDGFVDQVLVTNSLTDELVFFHRASRTVIFTDLIQQFPHGWHKGWRAWVAKADAMVGPLPAVPRKFRLGFRPRQTARRQIAQILDWPFTQVLMAHGAPVRRDAKAVLADAFDWLLT